MLHGSQRFYNNVSRQKVSLVDDKRFAWSRVSSLHRTWTLLSHNYSSSLGVERQRRVPFPFLSLGRLHSEKVVIGCFHPKDTNDL